MPHTFHGNTCPCGSRRDIRACCLQSDGTLFKKFRGVLQNRPASGYSHPDCYLRETGDCSHKISAEHYVSRSVLQAVLKGEKDRVRFSGAAWLLPGSERLLPPEALASKILCRHHNSALHPLDDAGLALVRAFAKTFDADALGGENAFTLASGAAFEAWAIKTAMGCVYSGTFAGVHGTAIKGHAISHDALMAALKGENLPPGCGLYMHVGIGSRIEGYPPFQARALSMLHNGQQYVIGSDLAIFNVKFRVITDPEGVELIEQENDWAFRPGLITFRRPDFISTLMLSWPDGKQHGTVDISLQSTQSRPV